MHVSTRKNQCYESWSYIYSRCFSFFSCRNNPEYVNYSADENWKDFENFKIWYEANVPNNKELKFKGFHLSPETAYLE